MTDPLDTPFFRDQLAFAEKQAQKVIQENEILMKRMFPSNVIIDLNPQLLGSMTDAEIAIARERLRNSPSPLMSYRPEDLVNFNPDD